MSKRIEYTVTFSEPQLTKLIDLIDELEAVKDGFDNELEETISKGIKALDKALSKSKIYRDNGILYLPKK